MCRFRFTRKRMPSLLSQIAKILLGSILVFLLTLIVWIFLALAFLSVLAGVG